MFLWSVNRKKIIHDFGIKIIKEQRKSSDIVPLVRSGWLFGVLSEKVAAETTMAMSNLITSAVIVCNCAPDITPHSGAN